MGRSRWSDCRMLLAASRTSGERRTLMSHSKSLSAAYSLLLMRRALSDIAAVSRQFYEFYIKHKGEFPSDCADLDYENRIRSTYPIHPSLFDQLYDYWSTLERFQRTRGVLRLMSTVVHALWNSQDAGPLIMPGSVPLENPEVLQEISTYVSDHWKPIIDTDIDGVHSIPVQIDADRPLLGKRATTRRLARALFMGSAPTLGNAVKGIERQNLWLGVAVPGDTVGNFGSALDLLSSRATYMYVDGQSVLV